MEFLPDISNITFSISFLVGLYGEYLIYLKIISVIISGVLLSITIYAATRSSFIQGKLEPFFDFVSPDEFSQRKAVRAWEQVERRMAEGGEANLRLAIIEADKILDTILKLSGFKGDTLGERLQQISAAQITNIEHIWRAHKLRNRLVHEPDYSITREVIEDGIEAYRTAFRQLGLLD